jgi:hypothetical protein
MSKFYDEFFAQKGGKHDELVMKCVSKDSINNILNLTHATDVIEEDAIKCKDHPMISDHKTSIDYETEVICNNGNFIIGYADILITVKSNLIFKPDAFGTQELNVYHIIIIEVKPELSDIGSVLRQLKTYEQCILQNKDTRVSKIIATYSNISEDVKDYLLHEGVHVIKF